MIIETGQSGELPYLSDTNITDFNDIAPSRYLITYDQYHDASVSNIYAHSPMIHLVKERVSLYIIETTKTPDGKMQQKFRNFLAAEEPVYIYRSLLSDNTWGAWYYEKVGIEPASVVYYNKLSDAALSSKSDDLVWSGDIRTPALINFTASAMPLMLYTIEEFGYSDSIYYLQFVGILKHPSTEVVYTQLFTFAFDSDEIINAQAGEQKYTCVRMSPIGYDTMTIYFDSASTQWIGELHSNSIKSKIYASGLTENVIREKLES